MLHNAEGVYKSWKIVQENAFYKGIFWKDVECNLIIVEHGRYLNGN